jgi:deazaflavin-dependent oxidoreductase (nitroreductase family)
MIIGTSTTVSRPRQAGRSTHHCADPIAGWGIIPGCWTFRLFAVEVDMPGLVFPQLKCCGNCDGAPLADSREDVSEHITRLSRILFVIPEPEVTPGAGGGPEPVIPAVAERPEKAAANYGHLLARCVLPRPGPGMAGGSHRYHAHRDPGPGKCCSRRHRPGGYRAVTALSLTLSTLPTLTRHRSGNKLMRRQGRAQRSQPTEGEAMPPTTPGQGPGNGEATRHARSGRTARPARQYRPGRGRHVENTIMSALVRAGLVPRSYLLTTRGRTTGLPRTNPVVPVDHDGRRWLVAPYGAVSWVHNARAAGRVNLARRRDTRDYTIREATAEEAGPVLKRYVRLAPSTRPYFQATKDSPVEDFLEEADRHPVFELVPAGQDRQHRHRGH